MKTTNLDKWLYLVRRIEEHREEKAVRELQKLYKSLIKDLRQVMGNTFADYADPETGKLTYADLHRQGLDARLLEEVAAHVSSVSSEESRIIRETVEQTYANCYSGMVQAVGKAVDNEELKEAFSAVEAVKPEVLRAAVNNPVHGLTLSDQLEKNRADIVWSIKQAVGVGLSEGDNYTTMAKRIQKELIGPDGSGGSYYKAVRIARTEAHRVREEGNLDAAQNLTEKLEPAGITMVKTWHTMKDERVRPNRARRTKSGWKYSKGGKYDHQKMEGVQVPIKEEFTLPSGAKTQAPGKSGVAGEDINCRCFLSYDVVRSTSEKAEAAVDYSDRRRQRLEQRRVRQTNKGQNFDGMSMNELKVYATEQLQTEFVGMDGASKEFVRETVKVISSFEEKLGGTIDGLQVQFGGTPAGVYAKYDDKAKTLLLKKTGNLEQFERKLREENARYRVKWHTDKDYHATETFSGTIWHELGHAVDIESGQEYSRWLSSTSALDKLSVRISAYAGSTQNVRVSKRSEAWAENFAAFMDGGRNKGRVATEITTKIEEALGTVGKKNAVKASPLPSGIVKNTQNVTGRRKVESVANIQSHDILKKKAKYIGQPIVETDNQHVREWYVANVSDIPNQIDKSKSFEEQVHQAYDLRNKYKHEARVAMSDRETAEALERKRPAKSFQELLEDKIARKGLTKQEALEDILKTASKTNAEVNKEFGL